VNPSDHRTATIELGELIPPRRVAIAWHEDRTRDRSLDLLVALAARAGSELDRSRDANDAPASSRRHFAQHAGGLRSVPGPA
jgi:hypothetical protein